MSFDYLMQAVKSLYDNNPSEYELNVAYEYILISSEETLSTYKERCSILSFNNDLELFIELTKKLIKIYEDMEEFERCSRLKKKMELSKEILNNSKD